MGSFWLLELLPIPVTSLLPVVLFPLLGIMTTAEVTSYSFHLWRRPDLVICPAYDMCKVYTVNCPALPCQIPFLRFSHHTYFNLHFLHIQCNTIVWNLIDLQSFNFDQCFFVKVSLYYMKSSCMLFIGGLMVAIAGCTFIYLSKEPIAMWKSLSCATKDDFMINCVLQLKYMFDEIF